MSTINDGNTSYLAMPARGTLALTVYSNPARANDPYALPDDVKVFYVEHVGWFWSVPGGPPNGSFATYPEAVADAQNDDELPPCALVMHRYCAGHARGNSASAPCDTNEQDGGLKS